LCVSTTFKRDFGISPRAFAARARQLYMPLTHSLTHSEYHPNGTQRKVPRETTGYGHFQAGSGDNAEFTLKPAIPGLRNIVIGAAVVLEALFLCLSPCASRAFEADHVGVEINLAERQRGPSEIPVRTGWVLYSPLTTQIIEFPTYVQTVKWTKDVNEEFYAISCAILSTR
jgi:hypothetical protein